MKRMSKLAASHQKKKKELYEKKCALDKTKQEEYDALDTNEALEKFIKNELISFGKYKGKTYKYVIEKDLDYLSYLIASRETFMGKGGYKRCLLDNMYDELKKALGMDEMVEETSLRLAKSAEYK